MSNPGGWQHNPKLDDPAIVHLRHAEGAYWKKINGTQRWMCELLGKSWEIFQQCRLHWVYGHVWGWCIGVGNDKVIAPGEKRAVFQNAWDIRERQRERAERMLSVTEHGVQWHTVAFSIHRDNLQILSRLSSRFLFTTTETHSRHTGMHCNLAREKIAMEPAACRMVLNGVCVNLLGNVGKPRQAV